MPTQTLTPAPPFHVQPQHVKLIRYHQDPSHGWIEVTRADIVRFGLADKISEHSYANGETVYLEEDCDAPKFIEALQATGAKVRLCPIHVDFDHPVRCLPRFKA